jgi:hypothetical protein
MMGCQPKKTNRPGSGLRCKYGTKSWRSPSPGFSLHPAASQQFFFTCLYLAGLFATNLTMYQHGEFFQHKHALGKLYNPHSFIFRQFFAGLAFAIDWYDS